MNESKLHFLNKNEANLLVNSIDDARHKCLILLMLDAGLRVSEAISLKFGQFDFKNQILNVKSLKKRNVSKDFATRPIPLSQRLYFSLAEYSKEFAKIDSSTFLFPSDCSREHVSRQSVNKYLKRLSYRKCNIKNLHPHTLRHTFATSLVVADTQINEIADLLGHQHLNTSRIYTHIPTLKLQKSVNAAAAINGEKSSFLMKIFGFMFAKKPPVVYIPNQSVAPIVGRAAELQTISNFLDKGINVILFGKYGVGKRLILDSIKSNRKILTFDDTSGIKKSLIYLLLYLYQNDKEQIANLVFGTLELDQMETRLSRQSIGYLCDAIIKITEPKEYILKIKQFDQVSPQALKVIDNLRNHFVILTAATEISITKEHFFATFEKLEIKNLNRLQSFELIHKLSYDINVDNYEVYRDHIWMQTDGNPKAITDMVERYKREPFLVTETIRSITHSGVIREIDLSYAVVLLIGSLAVMRYMTAELDNPALRTIGGMAMILLILTRVFVAKTKRKLI